MCLGPTEAGGPAIRLHRGEGTIDAEFAERTFQLREVALHDGLHVGVQHGRVSALVLAPLPRDLVRSGDRYIRQLLAQEGRARRLVLRRDITVQELNRDRLDRLLAALLDDRLQVSLLERLDLVSLRVDPFAHLEAAAARHEGDRFLEPQVVHVGAIAPSDLQDVAKALRCDERRAHAFAFGDGVDDGGAAVNEEGYVARLDAGEIDGIEHALGQVARRAQRFLSLKAAAFFVEMNQVGEGSADIDRQPTHRLRPAGAALRSPRHRPFRLAKRSRRSRHARLPR